MSLDLPKPIAAYFAADKDKGDSETIARCFTENAVVKDEGHIYNGLAAIKQWKAGASKNTHIQASLSRPIRKKERPSSPAGLSETFLVALSTFDSSSGSKETRSSR